jgi:hypothetical protein
VEQVLLTGIKNTSPQKRNKMYTAKLYYYDENNETPIWRHIRDVEITEKQLFDALNKIRQVDLFWSWEVYNQEGKLLTTIKTVNSVLF